MSQRYPRHRIREFNVMLYLHIDIDIHIYIRKYGVFIDVADLYINTPCHRHIHHVTYEGIMGWLRLVGSLKS